MRPRYSKARHRLACLALYRALLSHASHLPLPPAHKAFALSQIRRQFRGARPMKNDRQIHGALTRAYAYESQLRAAATAPFVSAASREPSPALAAIIADLQQRQSKHAEQTAATRLAAAKTYPRPPNPNPVPVMRKKKLRRLQRTPEQRALIALRHRRKPPILVSAAGFPMLRYRGRRQPQWLSALLAYKQKRAQRNLTALEWLENEGPVFAEGEDEWDRIVARVAPDAVRGQPFELGSGSWAWWNAQLVVVMNRVYADHLNRQRVLVKRMQKKIDDWVEDRERHRLEWRRRKRQRARRRRAERERGKAAADGREEDGAGDGEGAGDEARAEQEQGAAEADDEPNSP